MFALGAMACENGGKQMPPSTITERFDKAFEGSYKYGYATADLIFEYFVNEEYGYCYWSSSQLIDINALYQSFSDGGQDYFPKSDTYSVRAVRAF